jgi:hypothetical protein
MSRTAAAELARLRARFAAWSIRPVERGEGFTAQQRREHKGSKRAVRTHALTVSGLSVKLAEHEGRRESGPP